MDRQNKWATTGVNDSKFYIRGNRVKFGMISITWTVLVLSVANCIVEGAPANVLLMTTGGGHPSNCTVTPNAAKSKRNSVCGLSHHHRTSHPSLLPYRLILAYHSSI